MHARGSQEAKNTHKTKVDVLAGKGGPSAKIGNKNGNKQKKRRRGKNRTGKAKEIPGREKGEEETYGKRKSQEYPTVEMSWETRKRVRKVVWTKLAKKDGGATGEGSQTVRMGIESLLLKIAAREELVRKKRKEKKGEKEKAEKRKGGEG